MAEIRVCEQCGTAFAPRREHARFCSARCRVAWNRDNTGDRSTTGSALDWSIAAMRDATSRLRRIKASDKGRAFAVISEAVWWVTIVDGTLVRYHPDAYDAVLAAKPAAGRALIEETLAGLRFVRNQMGQETDHVDFVHLESARSGPGGRSVTGWRWTRLPEPALTSLPPHARSWATARYAAYTTQLAGRTVGETFERASTFLEQAAARAAAEADAGATSSVGG